MRTISKVLLLIAAVSLLALPAAAQNTTTVTATIVDPNGLPYSNASVQMQLLPSGITPSIPPPCNGQTASPCFVSAFQSLTTDVNGTFTTNLASNAALLPGGTTWQFTVSTPGAPPPVGTGPQKFSTAITISGATQNISATLNALAPALSHITGGGGGTPGGSPGQVQFNNSGAFGGVPLVFTPRSSGLCALSAPDVPCDNLQTPVSTNACIGGTLTSDPASPTFTNSAGICIGLASSAGSTVASTATTSSSTNNAVAVSGLGSSKGANNSTAYGGQFTATDDPADVSTGQTYIAVLANMSLTRASGSISLVEGVHVTPSNASIGGAPAAETVTSFYGIHVTDMLNKGTANTAALQIDNQTVGTNAFAIRTGVGKNLFGDLVTTAAPTAGSAGFNLPHGVAPTSPINGDFWTTTAGVFARVNGATVGPFGAGSGFSNPMTTIGDMIGGGAAGAAARIPAGKTGQIPTATNGATPAFTSPGVADGNGAAHVTTTPYVVACDSATAVLDRVTTIVFDSGASVITAPDHTASGCGGNMVFTLVNESGGTLTVNRGGADTFNVTGNVAKSIAATSFTIPDSGSATLNNGEAGIWNARALQPSAGGGAAGGTVTYTTNTTASSADNGKLVRMNCASPCTYTLPNPQPSTSWTTTVESVGTTLATVALGATMTYNGSASVPVLNNYLPLVVYANTQTSTDYAGNAPLSVGTGLNQSASSNNFVVNANINSGGLAASASTNFGTPITTATAYQTGNAAAPEINLVGISVSQVTAGVGCGAGTNTVTLTLGWTGQGGTSQTQVFTNILSITANGAKDTNGSAMTTIPVQFATNVTYATTSALASAGCSTTPQYAVGIRAVFP